MVEMGVRGDREERLVHQGTEFVLQAHDAHSAVDQKVPVPTLDQPAVGLEQGIHERLLEPRNAV